MAFHGNITGEGNTTDLIKLVSMYDKSIKDQMCVTRRDLHLVKPVHSTSILFCIDRMARQLKQHIMEVLQSAVHLCIIADEWTCKHSNKGYCSVSLRYVDSNLVVGTMFLGYFKIPNTRSESVTPAIIKALTRQTPKIDFNKVTAQTYDGASVMQGHLSGVQQRIKMEYCFFALNLHCFNHQLQLSVKAMSKGHNLVTRIGDNCKIIVKLINYSPKRAAGMEVVKKRIKSGIHAPPSYYTTLTKKVLDFCVTRWTVRSKSLLSIDVNHISLLVLFCDLVSDRVEKKNLDAEKLREIHGLIKYMQSFEFLFGIKLSIVLYSEVDKIATHLQGDKVCISNAMHFVSCLLEILEEKKGEFESFWTKVMGDRMTLNAEADTIGGSLRTSGFYSEISDPSCPRRFFLPLNQVNDTYADVVKAYWKEHYVEAFDTIINDLRDRLDSPLIKVFVEIENVLMNAINSPEIPISINLTDEAYGSRSNKNAAPLMGMTVDILKVELDFVKRQWTSINGNKVASSFNDVVHMVRKSIKENTPLRIWEMNAKYVLTLLRLILVAAGTSAYAERTFSLSRHIKTWLRSGMDDKTFDDLGLLAWYSDTIDDIINPVKIGNEFIEERKGRKQIYGAQFTEADFNIN